MQLETVKTVRQEPARPKRRIRWLSFEARLIVPALLVLFLVIAFPLLFAFAMSITDYSFTRPRLQNFVGLRNYLAVLSDPYVWDAARVTLVFTIGSVVLEFILGLGLALLLSREVRFKKLFFSILIIPMLITPVAVGLMWRLMLHPQLGIVNYILGLTLGVEGRAWLGDASLALGTLIVIDVWHQVPFMTVLLLAGLTSLPKEPFEAAAIDGAGKLQSFFHITLPLMQPVIVVALIFRTIVALKTYDLVYVMTKGGPGNATEMLSYFIYRRAFAFMDVGQAVSVSYLFLIVVGALGFFMIRRLLRENYGVS